MNGKGLRADGPARVCEVRDDAAEVAQRTPEQRERMRRAFFAALADRQRAEVRGRRTRRIAVAGLALASIAGGTVLWLRGLRVPSSADNSETSTSDVTLGAATPRPPPEQTAAPSSEPTAPQTPSAGAPKAAAPHPSAPVPRPRKPHG